MVTGSIHENGSLGAPMVSGQRFHGGGSRPVPGLWESLLPSPLRDSAGVAPASPINRLYKDGLTCSISSLEHF